MRRKVAAEIEGGTLLDARDRLEHDDRLEKKGSEAIGVASNIGGDSHAALPPRHQRTLGNQRRRSIFTSWMISMGLAKAPPRVVKKLEYPQMQRRLRRRQHYTDCTYYFCVLMSLFVLIAATVGLIDASVKMFSPKKLPRTVLLPELAFQRGRTLRTTTSNPASVQEVPILLPELNIGPNFLGHGQFTKPLPVEDDDFLDSRDSEDYGELQDMNLKFLEEDGVPRNIYQRSSDKKGRARALSDSRDDDYDNFFSFDDDEMRSPYQNFDDDKLLKNSRCRRPSWYRFQAPVCNVIHELDVATSIGKFYGQGSFRDVFSAFHHVANQTEKIVYKEIRLDRDLDYIDMENVRTDAMVAERFSSHPRFVNMYAFCGFSQLTEVFEHGDVEKAIVGYRSRRGGLNPLSEKHLKPRNDFTPSAKLKLALEMVEALDALHTGTDAIIVHDDVDLGQFLWSDHNMTEMKLNDFNRAEVMLWDEINSQFCKYKNGAGGGFWRSPEEYKDAPLSDKIDVYSVGNNIYSLLTGLYPFYDVDDMEDVQEMVTEGKTPTIDPRYEASSFPESRLVQIIEKCWIYDPDMRPNMSEVKTMLMEAIAEDERLRNSVGGPLPPRQ